VRQRGRKREAELAEALREIESRMDTMVRELTDTIERTQHEGQRTRMLGELAGSIDLDEVLNRVLEAAGAIEGVDAALITVAAPPGGEPIVATLGLSAEEAQRQAVLGPPDGREAPRAISMSYEYGALDADDEAIRSGVAVPLPGETAQLGLLTIFTRATQPTFGESQVSSSRSSRCGQARPRTRGGSARPGSSPTSTRRPACTTAATSTRRSPARSRAPTGTTGTSP
jgi:hypothetical protein